MSPRWGSGLAGAGRPSFLGPPSLDPHTPRTLGLPMFVDASLYPALLYAASLPCA